MKKNLSEEEIQQRIAILKRFKELLKDQRKKFNEYLVVLETQERSICKSNIEELVQHTNIEQALIQDISAIQKVIMPIEQIYKMGNYEQEDDEVINLKTELNNLQERVLKQNKKNQDVLKLQMIDLKQEIQAMQPMHKFIPKNSKIENRPSAIDISI